MKLFKALIFILLLASSLISSEYAVVVNKNSKIMHLSKKQIKDIFIMKKHFVESEKIVPVNMSSASQMRDEFEKRVLKLDRKKLNNYWVKQHFQGVRPPVVQSSNSSMKLFVKNVNGAIGYIPISLIDTDLRVLLEF
jgi:ABC-type phosphate transport system substrate-binding protein